MIVSGLLALLASTLFAGAAIYITLVEHPARLECGTELAATVFGPSYRRAALMQAGLALAASVAGLAAGLTHGHWLWYLGTTLIFAVVPFTFVVIMPTNKRLLDPARQAAAEDTPALLLRWGRLHAVRSLLSVMAVAAFATGLSCQPAA